MSCLQLLAPVHLCKEIDKATMSILRSFHFIVNFCLRLRNHNKILELNFFLTLPENIPRHPSCIECVPRIEVLVPITGHKEQFLSNPPVWSIDSSFDQLLLYCLRQTFHSCTRCALFRRTELLFEGLHLDRPPKPVSEYESYISNRPY